MSEPAPADDDLVVVVDGPVATLWLNRPEVRNAVDLAMWEQLGDHCRDLGADPSVRLLVVRGAGGHFCGGADISSLGEGSAERYRDANVAAAEALARFPKPTVAYVAGACVGGGAQLAMACDLRLAEAGARFGVTPARLGIIYPGPAVARMVSLIGPSAAKHLLFSAELVDADRALRIGLVDEVHEGDAAEARLAELTTRLATERSLLTQMASKELVDAAGADETVDDIERRWTATMESSGDPVEGVVAFAERRAPRFGWTHPADQP